MKKHGFTLIELLLVLSVMGLLSALAVSAVSSIQGAGDFNSAVSRVSGFLEQARAYAMAKNTFVYVGLAEVDGLQPVGATATPGVGRVVLVSLATKDGSRGFDVAGTTPATSWSTNYNSGNNLMLISKLVFVPGVHLPASQEPSANNMTRPSLTSLANDLVSGASVQSQTPLAYPLGATLNAGQYNFNRVIYFDPEGVCRIQGASTTTAGQVDPYLEIDLQPCHGDTTPTSVSGNLAAIQIDGMTGVVSVYRP